MNYVKLPFPIRRELVAWKKQFDGFPGQSAAEADGPSGPFVIDTDYPRYAEA